MKANFDEVWDYCKTVYGTAVREDGEDGDKFFDCPECGEPIFKEDYPLIEKQFDGSNDAVYVCPVCEEEF